jgi:D-beta-D-heptose 7-phosphate kinase/D-beta-D-heptose 1-phosphate adenosyltransferase
VVWDPHPLGAQSVAGVSLTTPNAAEATAASGMDDYFQAATVLRDKWSADAVAVTVGSHGAILDVGEVPIAVPASQASVIDSCGAGDKFAGAVTTGLLAGESTMNAVRAGSVPPPRSSPAAASRGSAWHTWCLEAAGER